MKKNRKGLVYSTEAGRLCPGCGEQKDTCVCSTSNQTQSQGDGIVRIMRQTKGRKGSGVSVVTGLPLDVDELKSLAKELKKKCGSGGTVRHGCIEIQGDHRKELQKALQNLGYSVKLSGG